VTKNPTLNVRRGAAVMDAVVSVAAVLCASIEIAIE